MKRSIWIDAIQLASRKTSFSKRLEYVFKAICFLPFYYKGQRNAKLSENNEAIHQSASGDDVYPLF